MSAPFVDRPSIGRPYRHIEHVMGMPVCVALRGRHADTATGHRAWTAVLAQLRAVDRTFSTYRDDSIINRLDRGELDLDQCPRGGRGPASGPRGRAAIRRRIFHLPAH